jgi:hypothetical protein
VNGDNRGEVVRGSPRLVANTRMRRCGRARECLLFEEHVMIWSYLFFVVVIRDGLENVPVHGIG